MEPSEDGDPVQRRTTARRRLLALANTLDPDPHRDESAAEQDDEPFVVPLRIRGVPFEFWYAPLDNVVPDDRFLCRCRLAAAPPAEDVEVYRRVLEVNQQLARGKCGIVALDNESREFVFNSYHSLAEEALEQIAPGLDQLADVAMQWRDSISSQG